MIGPKEKDFSRRQISDIGTDELYWWSLVSKVWHCGSRVCINAEESRNTRRLGERFVSIVQRKEYLTYNGVVYFIKTLSKGCCISRILRYQGTKREIVWKCLKAEEYLTDNDEVYKWSVWAKVATVADCVSLWKDFAQ